MAVYKDKKRGTWYVSVYITDKQGKRKRVLRRGFKTQREAKKTESEIIFNAELTVSDNPFFEDITAEYLEYYKQRRKASSYRKAKSTIDVRISPFFKNKRIKEITKRDIMLWHNKLLDKYKINSAKHTHTTLSTVLNYAIKMEYITINVAKEVGTIQATQDKEMSYWTLEEFKEFIKYVDDLKFKSFFMCLFFGGFRKSELLGVTWKDIDFKNNTIDINKTATRNEVTTTKNASSNRKIKMPQHTMNMLRQLKLKDNPKIDYFVFGEFYNHIHESTIDRHYDIYIGKSNVKRIKLHDFRHSHASYLINNGHDIQIVSKRLGHSNVSTTLDIYAHLYPNKEDAAIDQMEDDFGTADVIKIHK